MASPNIDFSPLTTRPGLFRLCFSALSLVAVALTGAGVDKSSWVKGKGKCSNGSCPTTWLVELGLALVVLCWLFSLMVVVAMSMPKTYKNNRFSTMITYGYLASGALFIAAFVLLLTFAIQTWTFSPCDVFKHDYWCDVYITHKSEIFQPGLFCAGAVIALFAGVLAIYIYKLRNEYGSATVSFTTTPKIDMLPDQPPPV